MNIFSFFKKDKKEKHNNHTFAKMMNGYTPIFSQFGENIYASDVVQQCVKCITDEIKKVQIKHIKEPELIEQNSTLNRILKHPNEIMTQTEFIEKVIWNLYFNYNSFIIPTYRKVDGKKIYTGLYPIKPTNVTFLEDVATGKLYVQFQFENGYKAPEIPYEDVIHLRLNFSLNDYMGGDVNGQPDNSALLQTLEINNTLMEGVKEVVQTSFNIFGVVKYNTMMDDDKTAAAIEELENKIKSKKSGFLGLDIKSEYTPITRDLKLVDKDTMEFIDKKILRNFGVSAAILNGDYTKSQYEAFYQKVIEVILIQISQEFTFKLFTEAERSHGNKIECYPEDLVFLTTDQKIAVVKEVGGRGALTNNQILKMFGMPPYEGGDVRYMSLNYADVQIANQYQLNNAKANNNNDGGEDNASEGQDEGNGN